MISNKAIVGSIGCITVGLVSYLLKCPNCLWALYLICLLMEEVNN